MIIVDFSFEIAYEIVQFLFICDKKGKDCSREEITKYINKTRNYTLKTIEYLIELGVVIEENNTINLKTIEKKQLSEDYNSCKHWLNNRVLNFKPFAEYIYFVSKKFDRLHATKLVKSIYEINLEDSQIKKIFDKWIKNIGIRIFIENNELRNVKELEEATVNVMVANKFLKDEFENYYSEISDNVINDLQNALLNIKKDPEESLNDTGRALEDFLRIDIGSGIYLSKCNGIAQVGNLFNQNNKFPTKLNNIAIGLASVRSMGKAHGVDKNENQRWKIHKETALSNFMITISLMKSYIKSKENILIF
ncbi:MAG: hypothetical protein KAI55_00800 [Candidatus Aenigmarchaeota archaeon]|nr:hypothetical protein [Candidatus Aenigmarchaeota archaeon]